MFKVKEGPILQMVGGILLILLLIFAIKIICFGIAVIIALALIAVVSVVIAALFYGLLSLIFVRTGDKKAADAVFKVGVVIGIVAFFAISIWFFGNSDYSYLELSNW